MGQAKQRKLAGLPFRTQKSALAPTYTQPPATPLPNFNTEQLSNAAIEREPEKVFVVCKHLEESRKNVNTDFHGYFEKYLVAEGGETVGCAFVKQCHECAEKNKDRSELVARITYGCLSDHTLKAMLKNPGPTHELVPASDYAKKLAAEAEAEGPDTVN